jgi:hypothetical protein
VSFVGSTALADELMLLGPRYASGVIVTQVLTGRPLPYVTLHDADLLPPAGDLWAWAHVHFNQSVASAPGEIVSADVAGVLAAASGTRCRSNQRAAVASYVVSPGCAESSWIRNNNREGAPGIDSSSAGAAVAAIRSVVQAVQAIANQPEPGAGRADLHRDAPGHPPRRPAGPHPAVRSTFAPVKAPKNSSFRSSAYGTATTAVGVPTFPMIPKTSSFS